MARASIPTLLSLDHYAKIMGLDPLHFCQGVSQLRPNPSCPQVWYQYTWQNPSIVSREHLSEVIAEAEKDLADAIGYWPTPVWLGGATGEEHRYTPPKAPGAFGLGSNVYGRYKSLQLNRGYVIEGGQRGTTSLGDACWIGLDLDGDGFYETASFTLEVDVRGRRRRQLPHRPGFRRCRRGLGGTPSPGFPDRYDPHHLHKGLEPVPAPTLGGAGPRPGSAYRCR